MSAKEPTIWDLVNSIMHKKDPDVFNDETEHLYTPFVVSRAMSQHMDCILWAQELNERPGMPKQMHFDFLFHGIRQKKRWAKWAKAKKLKWFPIVQEYFQYNRGRALEALEILTLEDLEEIKREVDHGGQRGRKKKKPKSEI